MTWLHVTGIVSPEFLSAEVERAATVTECWRSMNPVSDSFRSTLATFIYKKNHLLVLDIGLILLSKYQYTYIVVRVKA